ncbi:PH domain-containing protein [Neobacillus sp. MM2021_6]|uniref:PH domain-containing protein n=1 Tax=Bacillaceae TaxID=186817 RepID=UPI0014078D97|nr:MULTISPECIES: PH domain-containing protein [Bacillaceae]MBO0958624.1 PH domain-containing protein [Neobacillus sp. MM2021_6]NHC17999.1 hypothetical protein [Bacillus sp. MM2020_4]
MAQFEGEIKKQLGSDENLLGAYSGRTAPAGLFWQVFNEASWLTTSNTPAVLGITNKRLLVYKLHLNSSIDLLESIQLKDVASCEESNGLLNGGILIQLRNNKKLKFVFKKEQVAQIIPMISQSLS